MNSSDDKFYKLTGEIFAGFKALSEHNIETTTERLESFKDNMHWDLGFMIKLVYLPFRDLNDTNSINDLGSSLGRPVRVLQSNLFFSTLPSLISFEPLTLHHNRLIRTFTSTKADSR